MEHSFQLHTNFSRSEIKKYFNNHLNQDIDFDTVEIYDRWNSANKGTSIIRTRWILGEEFGKRVSIKDDKTGYWVNLEPEDSNSWSRDFIKKAYDGEHEVLAGLFNKLLDITALEKGHKLDC